MYHVYSDSCTDVSGLSRGYPVSLESLLVESILGGYYAVARVFWRFLGCLGGCVVAELS